MSLGFGMAIVYCKSTFVNRNSKIVNQITARESMQKSKALQ